MKTRGVPLSAVFLLTGAAVLSAQSFVPDLSGRWEDAGRPVRIEATGPSVRIVFVEPPLCDPQDGSTPRPREVDFEGTWAGDTLKGGASVCNFGENWGGRIGIQRVDAWLVLEDDGSVLRGEYEGWRGWAPMEIDRDCRSAAWPRAPLEEAAERSAGRGVGLPPGFAAVRREPIAFEPFRPEDLGACRSPEEVVTLPNGRSMTLERYLALLNRHERRLNEIGVTLHGSGTGERGGPDRAPVVARPAIEGGVVAEQLRGVAGRGARVEGPVPALAGLIEEARRARSGAIGTAGLAGAARPAAAVDLPDLAEVGGALGRVERWSVPLGDPASFFVGLDGEFQLLGAADRATLSFRTGAEGAVVGNRSDLLDLGGEIVTPTSGPMTATLDLRVLGEEFRLLRETLAGPGDFSGAKAVPVEVAWKTRFTIAGIGIDAKLGIRGESGVGFYTRLLPGSILAVIGPSATARAFVEANADVEIGRVSARSDLTLLEWQLVLWAAARLQVDEAQRPYLWLDAYGLNDLTALDGEAWIEACYWVLDWKGWHEKCQRIDLWDVLGERRVDYLFRDTDTVYLD